MDTITISPQRMLGGISVDCTIREQHSDPYTVTGHPVEQGAQISDHMYREPSQLVFEIGFSNSSAEAAGDENYVVDTYNAILALQATRQPMTIVTGKRTYRNMVILNPAVTTDQKTEAILLVTVTCREIIIVQTQTTTVGAAASQADPKKTGPVQDRGTVQSTPPAQNPTSLLSQVKQAQGQVQGAVNQAQGLLSQVRGVTSSLGLPSGFIGQVQGALGQVGAGLGQLQSVTRSLGLPSGFADQVQGVLGQVQGLATAPGLPQGAMGFLGQAQGALNSVQGVLNQVQSVTSSLGLEVPLIAQAQRFLTQVGGATYQMQAIWRDAAGGGGWFLDVADEGGAKILSGTPLVTGADLLAQFKHLGFPGQMLVQTDHDLDAPPTFDNLGTLSHLLFVPS